MPDDGNDNYFDKFVDDIVIKERRKLRGDSPSDTDTPQRTYNKKYREYPNNRTKFTVGR